MAFRWRNVKDDIALATEVARERPVKPIEWDKIAESLSKPFSNDEKKASLKGRGCREGWTGYLQNTRKKMPNL